MVAQDFAKSPIEAKKTKSYFLNKVPASSKGAKDCVNLSMTQESTTWILSSEKATCLNKSVEDERQELSTTINFTNEGPSFLPGEEVPKKVQMGSPSQVSHSKGGKQGSLANRAFNTGKKAEDAASPTGCNKSFQYGVRKH